MIFFFEIFKRRKIPTGKEIESRTAACLKKKGDGKEETLFHLFIGRKKIFPQKKFFLLVVKTFFFFKTFLSLNEKCHLKYLSVNIKPIPTNASVMLKNYSMECSQ